MEQETIGSSILIGMKCEACNTIHDGTYGSGRFCSTLCAIELKNNLSVIRLAAMALRLGRRYRGCESLMADHFVVKHLGRCSYQGN